MVSLSHLRKVFNRDYQEKRTETIFKVNSRKLRQGIPLYKIVDYEDDPVQGTFYEPHLQRVRKDVSSLFGVEKIIRKKRRSVCEMIGLAKEIQQLDFGRTSCRYISENFDKDIIFILAADRK